MRRTKMKRTKSIRHDEIIKKIKKAGRKGILLTELCEIFKLRASNLKAYFLTDDLIYEDDNLPVRYYYANF